MQLYLVDGRDGLAGGVAEKFFKIFDAEVGHADVADFAGGGKFLEFLPGMLLVHGKNKMEKE